MLHFFYASLFHSIYIFCLILISFHSLIWGKVYGYVYVIPDSPLMYLTYVCTHASVFVCLDSSYNDLYIKKSVFLDICAAS